MVKDIKNLFLVFNRSEWVMFREGGILEWTDDELNNADEKGFIGTKNGIDCYLARFISALR